MTLKQEEIAALAAGTFELHCLEITLRQQGTDNPRVFRGAGSIYQANDQLRFRIYAKGTHLSDSWLGRSPLSQSTKLEPEDFYRLSTIDYQGRPWEAEGIVLLDIGWSGPGGGSLIEEEIEELVCVRPPFRPRATPSFRAITFDQIKLPASARTVRTVERNDRQELKSYQHDTLAFSSCGVELEVYPDESWTVVTGRRSDGKLDSHFSERVREALRFASAQLIDWHVLMEYNPTEDRATIRGPRSRGPKPRIEPPVRRNVERAEESVIQLIDAYLSHVVQIPSEDYHPISAEWGEVLRSSTGTLETQATICCPIVESLCRCLPSDRRPDGPDTEAQEQGTGWAEKVLTFLSASGAPDRLVDRVTGLFADMRRPDADTRTILERLAASGAIDPNALRVWRKLRPASAHGQRKGLGAPAKLAKRCDCVSALLYQLVFHAIGYRGKYADPATRTWRDYPLQAANKS
jgi:hypothetical protein